MGVDLLSIFAKTAMVAVFMSAFGCIMAAGFAVPMSMTPGQPGAAAFKLAKCMGLVGSVSALLCGMVSTLYFFLVGVASPKAFLLVEMGLIGVAAVAAVTVTVILSNDRSSG
ncbi:MAG: hypothetical protein ACTHNU_14460 [Gaiellales bacterium]